MAMGSQFSLTLELTKLVPFGSLLNAAGHGLVRALREIQASGSDPFAEEDLAEVFGRNRLEPLFESTFRTAIKHSVIHHISSIAELVIEGGAGPTVRRSLKETGYFAMVVQLSLLTFTHELDSLSTGLTNAFERRTQGSKEYVAAPRYDALKGTLRAIREQTCGFMWELIISAVEKRLYPSIAWTDGSLYTIRAIPQVILQALLDSFTAIQHLPEHTRLQIKSSNGIPTIVVWAHRVLGLSVKVHVDDELLEFGDSPFTVYIDGDHRGSPEAALLNETDDPFFQLVQQREDHTLAPVSRHPIRDYGTRVLRLRIEDREYEKEVVYLIVTSCIAIARDYYNERLQGLPRLGELSSYPSTQRILRVSRILFASDQDVIDGIDLGSELPCVLRMPQQRPAKQTSQDEDQEVAYKQCPRHLDITRSQVLDPGHPSQVVQPHSDCASCQTIHFANRKLIPRLMHTVFVLCMVQGFDEDLSLHIDALDEKQYLPFRIPNARDSYESLAALLQGRYSPNDGVKNTSVVSAWGWSLCLSALACQDPGEAKAELAFVRGVPARRGERKRYIVDGTWSLRKEVLSHDFSQAGLFKTAQAPGDQCTLSHWTHPKNKSYFIGVSDDAFEVVNVLNYEFPNEANGLKEGSISCGFRSMQEVSWSVYHTAACEHLASLGQSVTLPDDVCAFQGFGPPPFHAFPKNTVFAGLVAGDSSARWILSARMLHQWRAGTTTKHRVCLRSRDCCFECAIEYAKSCQLQDEPIGLVL